MSRVLSTELFIATDITSRVKLGEYTMSADATVVMSVEIAGLNGAAATITLDVVITRSSTAYAADRRAWAKRDSTSTAELGPLLLADVQSGDVVAVYAESTNASDSSVLGTVRYIDAAWSSAVDGITLAAINAEVDSALADYDPPTKAELDVAVGDIMNDQLTETVFLSNITGLQDHGDANWSTAESVDLNEDQSGVTIGTVNALAAGALDSVVLPSGIITSASVASGALDGRGDWSTATDVTDARDAVIAGVPDAAAINAEVDSALADYDPPTRAEATADKDEVIASVGIVQVLPLTNEVLGQYFTSLGPNERKLSIAQNASGVFLFGINDNNNDPVNLTGKSVQFLVHDTQGDPVWQIDDCNISGDYGNYVLVTVPADMNITAGDFLYKLWNLTDDDLLGTGRFIVKVAPQGA